MLKIEECKEILEKVGRLLDEAGITYFLIYGTCLGAIRDKGFIEDDTDIDIGIYSEDVVKLKNIDFEVNVRWYEDKGKLRVARYYFQTILDIVPFYKVSDDWYFMKEYRDGKFLGKKFPMLYFDKLDEIEMYGKKYKVPDYTENYLTYLYTEKWREKAPQGTGDLNPLVEIPE